MNRIFAIAALAGASALPMAAQARVDVGVGINLGAPVYYGSYYVAPPPPVYYAPPPVYYYGPPRVYYRSEYYVPQPYYRYDGYRHGHGDRHYRDYDRHR